VSVEIWWNEFMEWKEFFLTDNTDENNEPSNSSAKARGETQYKHVHSLHRMQYSTLGWNPRFVETLTTRRRDTGKLKSAESQRHKASRDYLV
jgi:hypothetical protein